jgi:23S rRNA pseudouridine2605 synthase
LNGSVRRDPESPVRLEHDRILVDADAIERPKAIYLMMNKPRGVVTTASDEKGRETVYAALERGGASFPWVAPVGRLDKASEGLLLLTNDSEWGARIAVPETHLEKSYHVQIATVADDDLVQSLAKGVKSKGEWLNAKHVAVLRSGEKNCWIQIILEEGKNRQIRRMLETLGVEVLRLIRVGIGPLALGDLPKGEFRALTKEEKQALDRCSRARTA